jgi:hypothetical protein
MSAAGYVVFDDAQPLRREVEKGVSKYRGCIYERSTLPIMVFDDKAQANRVKNALVRRYRRKAADPSNTPDTTRWLNSKIWGCFVRMVEIAELNEQDLKAIENS